MSKVNLEPDVVTQIQRLRSRVDTLERSTSGHIVATQGVPPTVTVHANAGLGASVSINNNSSDVAGRLLLQVGTSGMVTGEQVRIHFRTPYTRIPWVVLQPMGASTTLAAYENAVQPYASAGDEFIITYTSLLPGVSFLLLYHGRAAWS